MKDHLKKRRNYWCFGMIIFIVLFDQLSKWWIISAFPYENYSIRIIPNILRFTYVTNKGAAFSFMQKWPFILIMINFALIIGCFLLIALKKVKSTVSLLFLSMIIGGGLGNLIDRIFRGAVIDYIDLGFWPFNQFAIFNFADCMVVVGAMGLLVYLICQESQKTKRFV